MKVVLTRIRILVATAASIALVGLPVSAQSTDQVGGQEQRTASSATAMMTEGETPVVFTGAAIRDAAKSRPVRIVLERWSTQAERNKVVAAFASDATPAELAQQFAQMEAIGSFRTITGQANPIRYAREYTGADGVRHLVLLTDNQIAFWKGASASGTLDRAYTLIEVRFGGDVQGEGKVTHAAGAVDVAAGRILIEDYENKALALIGVQKLGNDTPMDQTM